MDSATIYRILDANFNRAGEALRTIEDATRFGLNSQLLSQRAKSLRHKLVEGIRMTGASSEQLNFSRDAAQDVGRPEENRIESVRADSLDLIISAFKRLQQAVRSLGEFTKLLGSSDVSAPDFFERIRYDSYTLEKDVVARFSANRRLGSRRLYLLLIGSVLEGVDHETALLAAIEGGVDIVQLREKGMTDREFYPLADRLTGICRDHDVLCLVNDRTQIARAVDADGVHVGDDDLSIAASRKVLGAGKTIGATSHTLEEAIAGQNSGADYLGFGTMFPTETKGGLKIRGIEEWAKLEGHIEIPVYAIGGISLENVDELIEKGVSRIAVSAGILKAPDIANAAAEFKAKLEDVK